VAALVLASRRPLAPLRPWIENLLAPAILVPVLATGGGLRYGLLRPLAHLGVLVAAVRLPGSARRSRSFLTGAMLGVVAVAGIASSTHLSLIPYLLALLAYVVVAAGRLLAISLAESKDAGGRAPAWPPLRLTVGTVGVAALAAAPLFVVLPRLRSPFAAGPLGVVTVSGFRDAVALHEIGEIKLSRRVVMRVSFPDTEPERVSPDWLYEVGATLRVYRGGAWVDGRVERSLIRARSGRPILLAQGPVPAHPRRAAIELEADPTTIFLPLGAVAIELPTGVVLARESSGALRARSAGPPLRYDVRFDPDQVRQPPPDLTDLEVAPTAGDLRELAARATASTTNTLAAALAVEQYLQRNYHYSLSVHPPLREDPVRWFLFRSREGHCEFFASSMVLMLRTLGIPARLQAGFAGGAPGGDGGYVVRDSNAHAWVIAWVDGGRAAPRTSADGAARGRATPAASFAGGAGHWQRFDPTPPEGRPGFGAGEEEPGLRWRWEQLTTAWDRWVLTFSLSDQVEGARRALEALARDGWALARQALACATLLAAVGVLWRTRHRRRPTDASFEGQAPPIARALARVVAAARRAGLTAPAGTTPREFAALASGRCPSAASSLAWLVEAHERSRYAGGHEPPGAELRRATRATLRAIRTGPTAASGADPV